MIGQPHAPALHRSWSTAGAFATGSTSVAPPNGAPAWIGDICPPGNEAGGSWRDPMIGGGHVGDQMVLRYAADDSIEA